MKKTLSIVLLLALLLGCLSGCSGSKNYGANEKKGMLAQLPRYEGGGTLVEQGALNYALVCDVQYTGVLPDEYEAYCEALRAAFDVDMEHINMLGFYNESISGFVSYDSASETMRIAAYDIEAASQQEE